MKLLEKTKKAAKYTFVSMPLTIFGWRQIKSNHQFIADIWKTLKAPRCPKCHSGILRLLPSEESLTNTVKQNQQCYGCPNCHYQLKAKDMNELNELVQKQGEILGKQQLAILSDQRRDQLIRGHKLKSKIFWLICLIIFMWACYLLASGNPIISFLQALALCVPVALYAIRFSYRAWQIQNNILFEANAFKYYFYGLYWLFPKK